MPPISLFKPSHSIAIPVVSNIKQQMGEKDAAKSGAEEKKADAGGPVTVVLKLDMHCEGCAKKVKRAVRHLDGVDKVSADVAGDKLTVIGTVDPAKIKQRVEEKTGKKVEIVSPQPKKGGGGGGDKKKTDEKSEKKSEEKSEKKSDDKKADDKKPKEPAVSNVVLKTPLHCSGCRRKIKRTILKIKGVKSISMDEEKNLVTVTGTMDAKNLLSYLKERLRESVEIVQPKKEEAKKEEGGGDKKGKEGGGGAGGGEKKKDGGDDKKGEEAKVEANKMDYHGYSPYSSFYTVPMYSQGYIDHSYGVPIYGQGYANPGYNHGYVVEYSHPPPPPPPPTYLHGPPQMFSDENPNACSVM